jgi:hypothetical protein
MPAAIEAAKEVCRLSISFARIHAFHCLHDDVVRHRRTVPYIGLRAAPQAVRRRRCGQVLWVARASRGGG